MEKSVVVDVVVSVYVCRAKVKRRRERERVSTVSLQKISREFPSKNSHLGLPVNVAHANP